MSEPRAKYCLEHFTGTMVVIHEVRCPNCGPRLFSLCDDCGYRHDYPCVAPMEQFNGEGQLCECGAQVLIQMEAT